MPISPKDVHQSLSKHLLIDGFKLVLDIQKSHGSFMVDARTGHEILDFYTNFASSPIGYNHPKMTTPEFIQKIGRVALNKIANSDLYTVEMAEFVEKFTQIAMPPGMKYLFFIDGGALAVENAFKAAFDWKIRKTGRETMNPKIIHFREAFHGRTGYTLSVTNTSDQRKIKYFAKFNDWPRIINPKLKFPIDKKEIQRVQTIEKIALDQISEACKKYGDEISGLVIEPIQGEGGDNHFRKEFFEQLKELSYRYEFLLIYDEVQTGLGMTGKMWAFQHHGVEPDLVCFGKKTQICGFFSNNRIDEVENHVFRESSRINSTWGGNTVDMLRSSKYLEIIAEENLVQNAREMGEFLKEQLIKLNKTYQKWTNIRGLGLFIAFDCADNPTRDQMLKTFQEKGVKALPSGALSIRLRPPLNLSKKEAKMALVSFESTLKEM